MTNILQKPFLTVSCLILVVGHTVVVCSQSQEDITMSILVASCYQMRLPYLVWYSDLRLRRIIFISCLFKIFPTKINTRVVISLISSK